MNLLDFLEGDSRAIRWIKAHLDYPHDEWCLLWPFARNQGGYANAGPEGLLVHRIMCEYKNGLAPADKPEGAHECGNGHEGCVNPHHVTWKSHGDNMADMYKHARRMGRRYKLTPAQVDEIRALEGRARLVDIAEQFGVTDVTIRQIHAGKIWKQPKSNSHIFTIDELQRIRSTPQANGVTKAFAAEFGVHMTCIQRIRSGKYYKWLPESADASLCVTSTDGRNSK